MGGVGGMQSVRALCRRRVPPHATIREGLRGQSGSVRGASTTNAST